MARSSNIKQRNNDLGGGLNTHTYTHVGAVAVAKYTHFEWLLVALKELYIVVAEADRNTPLSKAKLNLTNPLSRPVV